MEHYSNPFVPVPLTLPLLLNIMVEMKNGFLHWNQHKILSKMDF